MYGERITLSYIAVIGCAAYFLAYLVEAAFCLLLSPKYPHFYIISLLSYLLLAVAALAGSVVFKYSLQWLLGLRGVLTDEELRFSASKAALIFVVLSPTFLYGYFQIIMVYRWTLKQASSIAAFVFMCAYFFILCAWVTRGLKPDRIKSFKRMMIYLIVVGPVITNLTMFFLTGEMLGDSGFMKFILSLVFYIGFTGVLILVLARTVFSPSKFKVNIAAVSFLVFFVISLVLAMNIRDRHIYVDRAESSPTQNPQSLQSPNIFLLVMDTARYDRLSCYGYHEQTTPNIDAFSEVSVVFENAISASPWTLPSHASMFTGLPAYIHNAVYSSSDEFKSANILSNEFTTLAEILRQSGYATGASISNFGYVGRWTGLSQGFDYYWCAAERGASTLVNILAMKLNIKNHKRFLWQTGINPINDAKRINTMALKWAKKQQKKNKRFFLFLNYMETHGFHYLPQPYSHKYVSPPKNIVFTEKRKPCGIINDTKTSGIFCKWYDNEIASLDHEIGRFLNSLGHNNMFDDSLIIVTSDHGELLGEHKYHGHQYFLYEELLKIPLIVKYPHSSQPEVDAEKRIQNIDIFAEILNAAKIPIPEAVVGTPFGRDSSRTIFSEVRSSPRARNCPDRFGKDLVCIYTSEAPGYKMILNPHEPVELYDLESDPREQTNLLESGLAIKNSLEDLLKQYIQELNLVRQVYKTGYEKSKLDKATRDRLRALGYIK
ncbi:sulfatase [Acidobacteriota bacterium]